MFNKQKPKIKLTPKDDNAFAILGKVSNALRKNRMNEEAEQFFEETINCNSRDDLLKIAKKFVNIINI